jgi:tetratricopeptide (TPR) repeat protein
MYTTLWLKGNLLMELSITQAVSEALRNADRALTLAEILAQVRLLRPVDTAKPEATVRGALNALSLAVSLGGRPAHYVWWPHCLAGNCFRQPLTSMDPASGEVILTEEVWLAFWPSFFSGVRVQPHDVMLAVGDGITISTQIDHLRPGQRAWGFLPNSRLADWFHQQGATTDDALIVRVLDVAERRYGVDLVRPHQRDETAMAARNQALAEDAAEVMRDARDDLADYFLIPRLIARGVYRDSLPPDPLVDVLAADWRFYGGPYDIRLAEKTVNCLERTMEVPPDPHAVARPAGDYRVALASGDEAQRQAWGEYLFDRGMDHRWVKWNTAAEAYYRAAVRVDPGHADAWVHLAILRFEEGRVEDSLACYERGEQAALARTIGDPKKYEGPFWLDLDSRPYMRALHGKGLCLWRLGRTREARQVFARMLRLNRNDNQGVRFLIPHLDAGLTWEESQARFEKPGL